LSLAERNQLRGAGSAGAGGVDDRNDRRRRDHVGPGQRAVAVALRLAQPERQLHRGAPEIAPVGIAVAKPIGSPRREARETGVRAGILAGIGGLGVDPVGEAARGVACLEALADGDRPAAGQLVIEFKLGVRGILLVARLAVDRDRGAGRDDGVERRSIGVERILPAGKPPVGARGGDRLLGPHIVGAGRVGAEGLVLLLRIVDLGRLVEIEIVELHGVDCGRRQPGPHGAALPGGHGNGEGRCRPGFGPAGRAAPHHVGVLRIGRQRDVGVVLKGDDDLRVGRRRVGRRRRGRRGAAAGSRQGLRRRAQRGGDGQCRRLLRPRRGIVRRHDQIDLGRRRQVDIEQASALRRGSADLQARGVGRQSALHIDDHAGLRRQRHPGIGRRQPLDAVGFVGGVEEAG